MNKFFLAVAFAANIIVFPMAVQGDILNTIDFKKESALFSLHNGKLGSKGQIDMTDPVQLKKVISRLNAQGLNKTNRPYLFDVLTKQMEAKVDDAVVLAVNSNVTDVLVTSTESCQDSDEKVCKFFNHTGVTVRASKRDSDAVFLVASALYSETDSTDHTLIDLALINENFEYITPFEVVEFFGEDTVNQKAKAVETFAQLSQSLVDAIANSEQIFGDAWVEVTKKDENGNDTVSVHNIMIEYDRLSILESIATQKPVVALSSSDSLSTLAVDDVETWLVLDPGGVAGGGGTTDDFTLVHPVNTVDAAGVAVTEEEDPKIIVCLNRNYGDCDYENVYPTSTPNSEVLLKIPFEGSLTIVGRVDKVYFPGDVLLPDAANGLATNIYVQLRELGGAYTIGNNDYADPTVSFAQELQNNMTYDATTNETTLKWNFPQNTTSFGSADLFGRYLDSHWIMNLVLDVTANPARPRPAAVKVYVIGSEDPSSLFLFEQPVMQFVYSCLAKGSQISLPNGINKAIEDLEIGEQVLGSSEYSPNKLLPLVIEDISVGVEHIPMIELVTSNQSKLLLTESHPVFTASGNAVWAKDVKVGDHILVAQGSTKTARVEKVREVQYDDNVYNLKLARLEGDKNYDSGESFAMVANGMIVGDLSMQYEVEIKQEEESTEDVLNRLPKAWHADYINSIQ